MKVEEILNKDLERKYRVTVDPKSLDDFINQEAFKISTTTKMDGFRQGKVPLSFIKSSHKFALQSAAEEHFVQEALTKIMKENKIQPASQPTLTEIQTENSTITFTIELEIVPELPNLEIEKIKLNKYSCEVGAKEIKKTEEEFLNLYKSFEPSKSAAKLGYITVIDAVGFMNGKEFEGGKVTDFRLELGSKSFIEGFEEGLLGIKQDETRTLKLKFPENYHMKDYSNMPVEFKVTVKEVLEPQPAKIDNELVKKLQAKDTKEIEDKIKESAQGYYDNMSELLMRKDLLDYLDKEFKISFPPKLLSKEIELIKHSEEGKDYDDKETQKIAERRTKLGFFMAKVSQENHIKVTEDDIKAEITRQIQRMPAQAQGIVDYYRKNHSAAEALRGQILENKTMLFMINKLEANLKKVTPEEISELYSKIIKRPIE